MAENTSAPAGTRMGLTDRTRDLLSFLSLRLGAFWTEARGTGRGEAPFVVGGYPHNHDYRVAAGRLIPSFQLYRRWRAISALYPEPLESFLDIGSSKGFFVLDAARRSACRAAVGIDVYEPFIDTSRRVKESLAWKNAAFYLANLSQVAADPAAYGGPFQTVLLVNTYHYLFWGSDLVPEGLFSHERILRLLQAVTTERLIFSSPLEVEDCPSGIVEAGSAHPDLRLEYSTGRFLDAARRLFDVEKKGRLGRRPLYVLRRC